MFFPQDTVPKHIAMVAIESTQYDVRRFFFGPS
jgi:hypothetical protein